MKTAEFAEKDAADNPGDRDDRGDELFPAPPKRKPPPDVDMSKLAEIGRATALFINKHDYRFPHIGDEHKLMFITGKPLLSWRVRVLRNLGHNDLYEEFKFNEPWDSPHNKKLLDRMPDVFKTTSSKTKTTVQFSLNAAEVSEMNDVNRTPYRPFEYFVPDGAKMTVMLAQVRDEFAVPWTKPVDWDPDPNKLPEILKVYDGRWAPTVCFEGKLHWIDVTASPRDLTALFTHNGGEAIHPNIFHQHDGLTQEHRLVRGVYQCGKNVKYPRIVHTGALPNGDILVWRGAPPNHPAELWNVTRRKKLFELPASHLFAFANSADGMVQHVISSDKTKVNTWDPVSLESKVIMSPSDRIVRALGSGDNGRLVVASGSDRVHLWHSNGDSKSIEMPEGVGRLWRPILSRSGESLAVSDGAKTTLWNVETGELQSTFGAEEEPSSYIDRENPRLFSPNSTMLVTRSPTVGRKTVLRAWSVDDGKQLFKYAGLVNAGFDCCFSEDSQLLAATAEPNAVEVLDAKTGEVQYRIETKDQPAHPTFIGKRLLAFRQSGSTLVWDLESDRQAFTLPKPLWKLQVFHGEYLVGVHESTVYVWKLDELLKVRDRKKS